MLHKTHYLNNILRVIGIVGLVTLTSCGTPTREPEVASTAAEAEISLDPNSVDIIYDRLDQLTSVASTVENSGADLDINILGLRRYRGARTDTTRAIVAGFLLSDISYLVAYNELTAASAYFPRLNDLSGRVTAVRSETLLETAEAFERNQDNQDSLALILHDVFHRTTAILGTGEYDDLSVLFITSATIENMYVNSRMIENFPEELLDEDTRSFVVLPLITSLLQQEPYLEDVIELLQLGTQTPFNQNLMRHLLSIDTHFDRLNIDESIRNNRIENVLPDTTFIRIREEIIQTRDWLRSQVR